MKAIVKYVTVVLFIIPYKVVMTFESVDEILKCNDPNESYLVVIFFGTICYAVLGGF